MPEQKTVLYSEAALVIIMILNSFAVDLMLYSGSGISAISSVPYALNQILPFFSLGTWTYFFQLGLVLILMILRKRFVLSYLFSFVIGLGFSVMLDVHQIWISQLPKGLISLQHVLHNGCASLPALCTQLCTCAPLCFHPSLYFTPNCIFFNCLPSVVIFLMLRFPYSVKFLSSGPCLFSY